MDICMEATGHLHRVGSLFLSYMDSVWTCRSGAVDFSLLVYSITLHILGMFENSSQLPSLLLLLTPVSFNIAKSISYFFFFSF